MREGDEAWIRDALERFEGPLIVYARRITGDLERARDVVQETFLRLLRQPRPAVQERLAEWLFAVCRNAALDVRRKEDGMKQRQEAIVREHASPAHDALPERGLEAAEEGDRVLALLGALPDRQQEALRLRFQAGLSYPEIARVMSTSLGNVGYLIHVGLMRLREQLRAPADGKVTR